MKDKYILDSSLWVEIERRNPTMLALTQPWIANNEICLVDIIIAELLRGVKTRRDYHLLQQALTDFPQVRTTWDKVADLAFRVARRGYHPPLVDLYIAQCVWENQKILVTQDKHFSQIARVQPFAYQFIKKKQVSVQPFEK